MNSLIVAPSSLPSCCKLISACNPALTDASTLDAMLGLADLVGALGTAEQARAFKGSVPKLLANQGFNPSRWQKGKDGCQGNPCVSFSPALVPILTETQRRINPGQSKAAVYWCDGWVWACH